MISYMCPDCGERVDDELQCPWCNGTDEKDNGLSHNFLCMCVECLG